MLTDEERKQAGAEDMVEDLEAPVGAQAEVAGGEAHPETVRLVRPAVRSILTESPSFTSLAPPPPPK